MYQANTRNNLDVDTNLQQHQHLTSVIPAIFRKQNHLVYLPDTLLPHFTLPYFILYLTKIHTFFHLKLAQLSFKAIHSYHGYNAMRNAIPIIYRPYSEEMFTYCACLRTKCLRIYSSVVACTCNPTTLEAEFRNRVGSIPVGGNSPSIGGWIV